MENRYFYLDRDGRVQGPFWLSVMRDHWKRGRVMMSTEVSLNGTDGWERLEYHPEIFEEQSSLPARKQKTPAKSNPVRLLVWMILLFLAYVTYLIVHWDDGLRLGGQRKKPESLAPPLPPPGGKPDTAPSGTTARTP